MTYEEVQKGFEEYMGASGACTNCGAPTDSFSQMLALDSIRVREGWDDYINELFEMGDITKGEVEEWGNPYYGDTVV